MRRKYAIPCRILNYCENKLFKIMSMFTIINVTLWIIYKLFICFLPLSLVLRETTAVQQRYESNWESLDSRPLPQWYDDAKIGIFIHWGVFSVPSFGTEWFWHRWENKKPEYVEFMRKNYPPGFKYQEFGPQFTAEFFDPQKWATLFSKAGAQYVVLTSKHHEGYTLWPSNYSFSWNSQVVGPKRDLVGDLASAVRNLDEPLYFGLYHSLYEWYNPLYLKDKASSFQNREFVTGKTMPELYELVNTYKPDVIWSDGDWEASDVYWGSTEFLSWLFSDSPVKEHVVVNDRWGIGMSCKHGSFYNCKDRYNPGVAQTHKWENCMTLDKGSWGYNRNASLDDYFTIEGLLQVMAETVSCGGNLLVNVGPTHDGRIPPIMEERLTQMGEWLRSNGEAIYKSNPWFHQNDTRTKGVWYTQNSLQTSVFAIVLSWPAKGKVVLGNVISTSNTRIYMKGYTNELKFNQIPNGLEVSFPPLAEVKSKWSWVLEMKGVQPKPK